MKLQPTKKRKKKYGVGLSRIHDFISINPNEKLGKSVNTVGEPKGKHDGRLDAKTISLPTENTASCSESLHVPCLLFVISLARTLKGIHADGRRDGYY